MLTPVIIRHFNLPSSIHGLQVLVIMEHTFLSSLPGPHLIVPGHPYLVIFNCLSEVIGLQKVCCAVRVRISKRKLGYTSIV